MTTTDFITDLTARMADDGYTLPTTWQERMKALISGAIDHDDVADLACCCGAIADSRAVNRGGPSFAWIAESLAEPAESEGGLEYPSEAGKVLLSIARYADGEDWQEATNHDD